MGSHMTEAGAAEPGHRDRETGETVRTTDERNFLVLDDSHFSRVLIKAALSQFNVRHIIEASNAVTAIQILREQAIDVILVDQQMPEISGVEFTKMVRSGSEGVLCTEVPIIMISGHCDKQTVLDARNAGVHEYLAKPIAPATLMKRIEMTLFKPRPFVRTSEYTGPDRRWLNRNSTSSHQPKIGSLTVIDALEGEPAAMTA